MTDPDGDTLFAVDAFNQLRLAAKAMRNLADGLERYANEPDPGKLLRISRDLKRTGWNSLYTAELICDVAVVTLQLADQDTHYLPEDFFEQADAHLMAVNYLQKSIQALKESSKGLEADQRDLARGTLRELSQRIKEVLYECKSF